MKPRSTRRERMTSLTDDLEALLSEPVFPRCLDNAREVLKQLQAEIATLHPSQRGSVLKERSTYRLHTE